MPRILVSLLGFVCLNASPTKHDMSSQLEVILNMMRLTCDDNSSQKDCEKLQNAFTDFGKALAQQYVNFKSNRRRMVQNRSLVGEGEIVENTQTQTEMIQVEPEMSDARSAMFACCQDTVDPELSTFCSEVCENTYTVLATALAVLHRGRKYLPNFTLISGVTVADFISRVFQHDPTIYEHIPDKEFLQLAGKAIRDGLVLSFVCRFFYVLAMKVIRDEDGTGDVSMGTSGSQAVHPDSSRTRRLLQ